MAVEIFSAQAQALSGLQVKCTSRQFSMLLDEPSHLGGTDQGMNPVEALLCSLAACKVIVAKAFAPFHQINLKSLRIKIEGELDPDGFLGKNKTAKIGFSQIHTQFFIEADNTPEQIQRFINFVNSNCPVHDSLANAPCFTSELHLA
ncbi:OsmC family protein [Pseudomonas sp. F1_0610]|uniref:OsmC family protein n=1 Tax=Pseudomonas sp. F1_0610 TaxID=3114284 RepID=UPI0039C48EEA